MDNNQAVEISLIEDRSEFLARAQELDPETVARYQEVLDKLPPIEVWRDPETDKIYLIDGRHRREAHRVEGRSEIQVTWVQGTFEDMLVHSRVANMGHGLSFTPKEWHQAIRDIFKVRFRRTNTWIAKEAGCSQSTISRIRAEMEESGQVPRVEELETESGGLMHRAAKSEKEEVLADDTFEEEELEEDESYEAPMGGSGAGGDGYDDGYKEQDEEEEEEEGGSYGEREETSSSRKESSPGAAGPVDGLADDRGPRDITQVTLKLAQLGEPLAAEAGLWINENLESIPVTVLIVDQPPKGLTEVVPEHENCLIILRPLATKLNLLI